MKKKATHFDVIVIGVGGMGASACYHLAQRGCKVLGLEQFALGHSHGSSHGQTRMIRRAYFEHSDYIPLLNRSYELWNRLENESGEKLWVQNGLIIYGNPNSSAVYKGTIESAAKYNIAVEKLGNSQAIQRFPLFSPEKNMDGVFEPDAGFLYVEKCVLAHARLAQTKGAIILENENVLDYSANDTGVVVKTEKSTYTADRLVITGGPWNTKLLNDLGTLLKLKRMIQYWFKAPPEYDVNNNVPCFAFHTEDDFYYGFPMLDGKTIKIAAHFAGRSIQNPAQKNIDQIPNDELQPIQEFVRKYLKKISGNVAQFSTCIYTMTPDEHFLIDRHPKNSRIVFAAGFSGHGFKFSSVIGEILSDLTLNGTTAQPIDFLRLRKFT
jgi:sarcosine oxidase